MGGQQSTRNIGSELHSMRENAKYYKRKKRRQWFKDNVEYKGVEKASCNIKYISHGKPHDEGEIWEKNESDVNPEEAQGTGKQKAEGVQVWEVERTFCN